MSVLSCAVSTRVCRAVFFFTFSELILNRNRAEGPIYVEEEELLETYIRFEAFMANRCAKSSRAMGCVNI